MREPGCGAPEHSQDKSISIVLSVDRTRTGNQDWRFRHRSIFPRPSKELVGVEVISPLHNGNRRARLLCFRTHPPLHVFGPMAAYVIAGCRYFLVDQCCNSRDQTEPEYPVRRGSRDAHVDADESGCERSLRHEGAKARDRGARAFAIGTAQQP